jgi:hypothetical protein
VAIRTEVALKNPAYHAGETMGVLAGSMAFAELTTVIDSF